MQTSTRARTGPRRLIIVLAQLAELLRDALLQQGLAGIVDVDALRHRQSSSRGLQPTLLFVRTLLDSALSPQFSARCLPTPVS